jgi:hypothetical protein
MGIRSHPCDPIHTSVMRGVNTRINVITPMARGFQDDDSSFLRIRAAVPASPERTKQKGAPAGAPFPWDHVRSACALDEASVVGHAESVLGSAAAIFPDQEEGIDVTAIDAAVEVDIG